MSGSPTSMASFINCRLDVMDVGGSNSLVAASGHVRSSSQNRCLKAIVMSSMSNQWYHSASGVEFTTCWGRVEECWVAGELWIGHKKVIFFPCSSAMTCANRPLGVDQRVEFTTCWGRVEECWVAGELWIDHKKVIFFPYSSATTCANSPLGVDQ
ncbi:hypothetical protein Taro_054169, partial [Colocasia esculenta]|nr:hypothetical protein [Colocasia esculenta]